MASRNPYLDKKIHERLKEVKDRIESPGWKMVGIREPNKLIQDNVIYKL
ncbi:hypothetical protein [Ferroplasma acidiphilum]|nr:hypothetical protein [Ferroplasma acidiphilum]WMT53447.1 MAG: hypothetical protein RE473_01025 [Ferroplasma acidiphilum]